MTSRRKFLQRMGLTAATAVAAPALIPEMMPSVRAASLSISHLSPELAASDNDYWATIQQAFTSSPGVINLNNGGVSPQPLIVQDALDRYNRLSNEGPAYYMWNVLAKGRETVRTKLAKLAGVDADTIAINRNSTEALETIIYGLNLKKGDELVTSDQVYPNMKAAIEQRRERDGIKINYVKLPVPCNDHGDIVSAFEKAMTPKTKVVLIMHMVNLTGQIMPVREVADIAHKKGIEVIVDGAHTFGHLDYKIEDLGADYFGTSLHKWLCAPFGTGLLYVKKDKIKNLWPLFGAPDPHLDDIRKFEHLGTRSFPTELAIGHAIGFHNAIGSHRKHERLHYLKQYWMDGIKDLPGVGFNVSSDKVHSCALGNFYIEGKETHEITKHLMGKHNIYTIGINHDDVKGVRVTPHIYTPTSDLDLFIEGVKDLVS
jgi:selenocysteine lyase/cysteine desulfurase